MRTHLQVDEKHEQASCMFDTRTIRSYGSTRRVPVTMNPDEVTCARCKPAAKRRAAKANESASRAIVETIPLNCVDCGAIHSNEQLERTGGKCPRAAEVLR